MGLSVPTITDFFYRKLLILPTALGSIISLFQDVERLNLFTGFRGFEYFQRGENKLLIL